MSQKYKIEKICQGFDRFFFRNFFVSGQRLSDTHLLAPATFVVAEFDDVEARCIVLQVESDALAFRQVLEDLARHPVA
jgi:hypothetical protein